MGASVSVSQLDGAMPNSLNALCITPTIAASLIGPSLWPIFAPGFSKLPQPVTLSSFRAFAEQELLHQVATAKTIVFAIDIVEKRSLAINEQFSLEMVINPVPKNPTQIVTENDRLKAEVQELKRSLSVRDEAVRDEAVRDEAVRDEAMRDEAPPPQSHATFGTYATDATGAQVYRPSKQSVLTGVSTKGRGMTGDSIELSDDQREKQKKHRERIQNQDYAMHTAPAMNGSASSPDIRRHDFATNETGDEVYRPSKQTLLTGVSHKARGMVSGDAVEHTEDQRYKQAAHRAAIGQIKSDKKALELSQRSLLQLQKDLDIEQQYIKKKKKPKSATKKKKKDAPSPYMDRTVASRTRRFSDIRARRMSDPNVAPMQPSAPMMVATIETAAQLEFWTRLSDRYKMCAAAEQEDMLDDIMLAVDNLTHQSARHGIKPGKVLLDNDDEWDGDPCSLVQDLVHLACDYIHKGDEKGDESADTGGAPLLYTISLKLFAIAHCFHPQDDAAVLCGMGQAVSDLGFCGEAVAILEQSLELNAEDHVTLLHLGTAYHDNGQLQDSVAMLEKGMFAAAKAGDHYHCSECLRKRGNAFEELGDFKAAAKNYAIGMEMEPAEAEFVSARAMCVKNLGQTNKATALLIKAKELYQQAGDEESAGHCVVEIEEIRNSKTKT